ncbi:non-functional pseudokinase ZED1-like isoform X2 [Olea europaea var. sylvestris]|uniref:non-functional pseudokinase ZED1-like isoform X2 n=1 Tax=Olea europaea var. sylvestris TaxID=158386 RepID=UPI000C1D75F3|nr:non-functional pseudokinase ZED1-like isoform X2 [Olea europaea var. sylvestris]
MEWVKRKIRFLKRRNEKLKLSPWYMENGGKLLEGLIASSNGKYNIPYRVFTVEELNKATDFDFTKSINYISRSAMWDGTGYYISGIFQQRSILVKKFHAYAKGDGAASYAVNDIVYTVQMNRHKNVLKILGCCLDLEIPAIIYEIGINYGLLYDLLCGRNFGNNIGRSLSWSNRLKIATDVANAVAYLHTAFPTPIIHRDLGTKNIVIDNNGVAKLVDFSLCVALPPGESQVEVDIVVGTKGHLDPDYMTTGIITEKEHHVEKNELSKILDPIILEEIGEIEHQLQAFSRLALRCILDRGADRPYIIDVAKELVRIQRSAHPTQRSSR